MAVKEKELIKIEIRDSWGFQKNSAVEIQKIIETFKPLFFDFLNPHCFDIFFAVKTKNQIIMKLSSKIKECCSKYSDELESTSFIAAKVFSTFETSLFGKVKSLPTGMIHKPKESIESWHLQ